jgi:putative PEP-CTERM system TPR-repeat lipoprotein
MMLARLHMQAGEQKKALEVMDNAVIGTPDNPEVLELAGQVQLAAGERNRALSTWSKWVMLQPNSALALYRLATAQLGSDDLNGAASSLRKAIQLRPQFAEAQGLRADVEARSGRTTEALKIAKDLQRQNATNPLGWAVEGDIQTRRIQPGLALEAYEKAYAVAPSGQLAIKLHAILAQSGKVAEAEGRLTEWLKRSPSDDGVRLYLAQSYLKRENYKGAIEEYEAFLGRRSGHIVALNNLAWCYHQVRDARAVATAEKALSLKPDDPAIMDTLGWILIENKDYQRGIGLLQKASAKAANASEIRYHYAVGLFKAGDQYRAKEELDRLLLDFPKFTRREEASKLLAELRSISSAR